MVLGTLQPGGDEVRQQFGPQLDAVLGVEGPSVAVFLGIRSRWSTRFLRPRILSRRRLMRIVCWRHEPETLCETPDPRPACAQRHPSGIGL